MTAKQESSSAAVKVEDKRDDGMRGRYYTLRIQGKRGRRERVLLHIKNYNEQKKGKEKGEGRKVMKK